MAAEIGDAFARLRASGFVGAAIRLQDRDLPSAGSLVGVGEDEIHAIVDVESNGAGFDRLGRPKMLFEPHVFWRHLGPGAKRDRAASLGIAYAAWRPGNYPSDSYPRLAQALAIDETAALQSASWGLTQILGENFRDCGYATPQDMVLGICASEGAQLTATVLLIRAKGLAGKLKAHDWPAVARGWNGPGYARNAYDDKLAARFRYWRAIPDTPWNPALVPTPPVAVTPLPLPLPPPAPAKSAPAIAPTPAPQPGLLGRILGRLRTAYPPQKDT